VLNNTLTGKPAECPLLDIANILGFETE